jgi:parvulin-like peptidyl-prolyl isomerase
LQVLRSTVLAAVLLAACGGPGSTEMARVGDSVVTEADLATLYESDTVPIGDQMRDALFRIVAREVLIGAMEADLGITFDEDAAEVMYQELLVELATAGVTPAEALGVEGAGNGMVRFNADLQIIRTAVVTELLSSPEFLDEFFEDRVATANVCVSHILVEEREEADAVLQRLADGEVFAEVSAEVTIDLGTPTGDLGCRGAAAYVAEFAEATLDAPIGEPFGPVESQFGWHVIVVSDRSFLDRAEVEADPTRYIDPVEVSHVWNGWVSDQLQAADVEVVERYGTWSPTGIVAPSN